MEDAGIIIQQAGDKGKGLFATKYFKEGDVIFKEIPLVCCQFAWNSDYGYSACDHCMRPLETPEENFHRLSMNNTVVLPYPECSSVNKLSHCNCYLCGVKYCSPDCKDLAWKQYHKTLCFQTFERNDSHPLHVLKEVWKNMHYPPESCTIMLLARMAALIQQSQDKDSMRFSLMQFCHKTSNEDKDIVHKLLRKEFANDIDVIKEAFANSVNTSCIEDWITPEGFLSILALVGTNGQGIGTSSISEWVRNVSELQLNQDERSQADQFIDEMYESFDKAVGDFLNNEGIGLFPLQSSCNHSCTPNAESSFPDNNYQLVMKAKADISPGDEICVSYIDECVLDSSRHTRRKYLMSNYLFLCQCDKCEAQSMDPDVTSEEEEEDDEDEDLDN